MVKGRDLPHPPRRAPAYALGIGYTLSGTLAFALAYLIGFALAPLPFGVRALIGAAVLLSFLVIDTEKTPITPPTPHRQTPRDAIYRFGTTRGALLWGLDAGLAVTTFRVTSMTWCALAASALHLIPWWTGALYGAAFAVGSTVAILLLPVRETPGYDFEPVWINRLLGRMLPYVRGVAFALMAVGTALCVARGIT